LGNADVAVAGGAITSVRIAVLSDFPKETFTIPVHLLLGRDIPIARLLGNLPDAPERFQQMLVIWILSEPRIYPALLVLGAFSG